MFQIYNAISLVLCKTFSYFNFFLNVRVQLQSFCYGLMYLFFFCFFFPKMNVQIHTRARARHIVQSFAH
jgi:hypothetical protein